MKHDTSARIATVWREMKMNEANWNTISPRTAVIYESPEYHAARASRRLYGRWGGDGGRFSSVEKLVVLHQHRYLLHFEVQ